MPPKVKITREQIVHAALDIVRSQGIQGLNARNVAAALNCSTQPIFSNFTTIEQLQLAVVEEADHLSYTYMQQELSRGEYPSYKATGMAYIRFAKEEKQLFQLLYMRDRRKESIPERTPQTDMVLSMVHDLTGLRGTDAQLFHLEIWTYVHGIATMFATDFFDLDWELVSRMITDCYQGLRKQHGLEE